MKKIFSILLVLAMLLGFAACGEEKTPENLPLYSQGLGKDGVYELRALDYVTLPEYKGVDFGEEFWTVDPAEIDKQIDTLKTYYADETEITDRAVVSGDTVNIDYSGTFNGEVFNGGTATGQEVTAGSADFVDNMLDSLIGRMPGETYETEVVFPDPYQNNPELSGQTTVFTVTVNSIIERDYPEIDDAFVAEKLKDTYKVKNLAELRDYIEEKTLESQQAGLIDSYLYENAKVSEIPEIVFEHQKNAIRKNYEDSAKSYGLDVDTLVSYYGYETLEELLDAATDDINMMSEDALVYQAVAEDLGIKIANTDVADYFEKTTGSREYEAYQNAYGLPYLKFITLTNKVVDVIRENAAK